MAVDTEGKLTECANETMVGNVRGLDVDICIGLMPELRRVYRLGARDALLGQFIHPGSHGPVVGLPRGHSGLKVISRAARSAAATIRSIQNAAAHDINGISRLGTLRVLDHPLPPEELIHALHRFHAESLSGALSLLFGDPGDDNLVVHILWSSTLPSMGPLPPCSVEDLQATWIRLAGAKMRTRGRYLLEEPRSEWNNDQERLLTERLRKLYGE